jgi:2-methylisocitrate lyase-like PEP mutase family enzyme
MTQDRTTGPTAIRRSLKDLLRQGRLIAAPGVYDPLSAKLADQQGFEALYMSGFATVAAHLGLPDAGLATYSDMVGRLQVIAGAVSAPLIADGDTGFGGLLNVERTVLGYEAAGAAAIQLEDQEFPKKCGHTPDRRVIPLADAARKIEVAAASRRSKDFLIVARTDARTAHGLDEALRRAEAFAQAGADVLFLEALESEAEMERVGKAFDLPLLINVVEGGRTPVLPAERLLALGFRLAIFPVTGLLAAAAALQATYAALKASGSSAGLVQPLYPFADFTRLMGFPRVWEFEKRWA